MQQELDRNAEEFIRPTWPDWMVSSENDALNEWLDRSDMATLARIKGMAVRTQDAMTAFYASQRMLAKLYMEQSTAPGVEDAIADMLAESMDACLQLGMPNKAIAQGNLADELLSKQPDKKGEQHLYVLYALAMTHLEQGNADQALALLDRIQALLPKLPQVGWREPEQVGLCGLRVEALLRRHDPDALAAAQKLHADMLAWAREAAQRQHKEQMEKAFAYAGHALDLCIQAALQASEPPARWALDAVCATRGVLIQLFPAAPTIHSINPDAYQRALNGMQAPPEHLVDYVEYEDLDRNKQLVVFTSPVADAKAELKLEKIDQ